jgi:hypothetical protein
LRPSGCSIGKLLREVRRRAEHLHEKQLPREVEEALDLLDSNLSNVSNPAPYEFDRKFLFKVCGDLDIYDMYSPFAMIHELVVKSSFFKVPL